MNMHIKWYINFPSSYIKFTYKPRDLLILYMPLYFGLPTNFFSPSPFFPSPSLFYFSILSIREYIYIYMFYFSSFFFFFFYMYYIAYFRWFSPNEVGIRGEILDADHVCNYYSRENGYLFNAFGVTVSIITSRIF